ncbi:MAG: DUF2254 domain-containing protein [Thiobacillaceae bacterium]
MFPRGRSRLPDWAIPLLYAVTAVFAAIALPRIEHRFLPGFTAEMSAPAAMAIYTSVGSGMLALTGIVFALAFVMVQFSATAYSPRLVLWISRDPVIWHAIGVFTATFLYAIGAIAWVDRNGSGKVPFLSVWVIFGLLLASVALFVALIQRISLLQINRMLSFTGDLGRQIIEKTYPRLDTPAALARPEEFRGLPVTQTLLHTGAPQALRSLDQRALLTLGAQSGGVAEIVSAIGDTLIEGTVVLQVLGGRQLVDKDAWKKTFEMGEERTFEQDPKYAIRLLVDIAIRALSPAINDPTTAVQALDQIEDLLLRLGNRRLEIGAFHDSAGALRLVIPHPTWEDFLRLAFDETRFCGATSIQVMRRMKALVSDLIEALPEERHEALKRHQKRLDSTIARSFADPEEQLEAAVEDRQGLGVPRSH